MKTMLIDTIIGNPEEILPKELHDELEVLVQGNSKVVDSIITQIKAIQDDQKRKFALLFIYELEIGIEFKKKIYNEFIFDTSSDIQYHIILFAGMYNIAESISALQTIKNTSKDFIQYAAIWALVKIGHSEGLTNQITEKLSKVKDDRALTLVAAALYLLNNNKNSQEMLLLKDYFLNNFYDEEKQQFYDIVLQSIDFSHELIAHLLWHVGYKFVEILDWDDLQLDWLINRF